jgi:hypothetical protein
MLRAYASLAALLFAVLGVTVLAAYAWPFHIDDALISARYAHRLISGQGYTFNDGQPSDGVTGPLWLVPMMLGERLAGAALPWAKACGFASMLCAIACCVAQLRNRHLGRLAAWPTALICVSSMPIAVWSVAGLETGAAALLFVLIVRCTNSRFDRRGLGLGAAAALAVWLRPEMLAAAVCAIACRALAVRRDAVRALAVLLLGVAALAMFRLITFGALLPLSIAAKPAELVHGLNYLRAFLLRTDTLCFAIFVGAAAKLGQTRDRTALAIVVVHVLACTLAGGDWMPGRRLLVPALVVFAMLAGVGFAQLCARRSRWYIALLMVGLGFSSLELVRELPAARAAGREAVANIANIERVLRAHRGPIVALDVGAIGYALLDTTIIDLGGLTCPTIAHRPGGHLDKRIDPLWLEEHAPTWLVLHSAEAPRVSASAELLAMRGYPVEQHVASLAYVRESFGVERVLQIAPRYFYVFLLRRELIGQPQE